MADARKDRRTLLSLKIRYKSATLEDFIERYSMDISRGGVFIKAKNPLAVGTLLKFEFLLQDQSTLIHGVGRVVWRREEPEADEENPAGMGIKFVKMDPDSRSVVQRIVEDRALPGVFEQGKGGISSSPEAPSEPGALGGDQTKVRHVSEFLASAMEEGGAGEAAMREARAAAEQARQIGHRAAARGAFSAQDDVASARRAMATSPSRAMSAFGGASVSTGGPMRSSAAPAMDELDAEDDFLDDERTRVKELGSSEFPDADATVVSAEASPFARERRQTPVVPTQSASGSMLDEAVSDLFGTDSFGPAEGEVIDESLLDPTVQTVPPKASALPRSAVPNLAGAPSETFRVPEAPAPVALKPPRAERKRSRPWLLLLLFVLLLAAAGLAMWRFGLTGPLEDLVAPYLDDLAELAPVLPEGELQTATAINLTPSPAALAAAPSQEPTDAKAPEGGAATQSAPESPRDDSPAPTESTRVKPALVKISVVSIPSRAFVSINGRGIGRTPLEVQYEEGATLSVFSKARGFLARRKRVVVDAQDPEIKLVLKPLPYVVEIVTQPPGARARVAGGAEVTTPGQLTFKTMPGSTNIVISKDGYKTTTESLARSSFIEEPTRMRTSIQVDLARDSAGSDQRAPVAGPEPVEPEATLAPAVPEASVPAAAVDAP